MTSQSPQSPDNTGELGFLGHLVELRDRLLRMVLSVGVIFIILAPFAKDIYTAFAAPLARTLPEGQSLISIDVAAVFFIPYKLVLMLAFLIALPYVLYQLWGFIAPGLYRHEKRLVTPLITSSVLLFYLGILFAYFITLPLIFSVLQSFTPDNVDATPDIAKYLDFVMMMFMAFGVGFEMPVATVLLISTGISTREDLAKKRPYVLVAAFTVGMLLTPPDVISQILLAVPMWLLFEVGLLASKIFAKQIEASRKAREEQDKTEREAELAAQRDKEMKRQAAAATTSNGSSNKTQESWEDEAKTHLNTTWEDDSYIFDKNQTKNNHSLSDAEMDAELERMEAEQAAVEKDFEQRHRPQQAISPESPAKQHAENQGKTE